MIPSGSSWLMGVKVKRIEGRAHSMIEKGKKISIQKLCYMMGHAGKHLINPTTKYLGIQTTGKLNPCDIVQKEKSDKPTYQKFLKINKQRILEKEYSLTLVQLYIQVQVERDIGC